jgi:hypothetical protein
LSSLFPISHPRDYIELATHAAPGLSQSARDFCDENGFSFIEIPAQRFCGQYEKEPFLSANGSMIIANATTFPKMPRSQLSGRA